MVRIVSQSSHVEGLQPKRYLTNLRDSTADDCFQTGLILRPSQYNDALTNHLRPRLRPRYNCGQCRVQILVQHYNFCPSQPQLIAWQGQHESQRYPNSYHCHQAETHQSSFARHFSQKYPCLRLFVRNMRPRVIVPEHC